MLNGSFTLKMSKIVEIFIIFIAIVFKSDCDKTFCENPALNKLTCVCISANGIMCSGLNMPSHSENDPVWRLFETVPNTKTLEFLKNFNYLPTKMLTTLVNLEKYSCTLTNIMRVPQYSFKNIKSLNQIDVVNNKNLTTIERHAFFLLPNLELLQLYENKLKTINEEAFIGLPKLKSLMIYDNNIEELPKNLFQNLKSLRHLNLQYNFLKTLDSEMFSSITQNFLPEDSSIFILNNTLICNCGLHWFSQIFEETKSIETKRFAKETNCTVGDGQWIQLLDYKLVETCVPDAPVMTTTVPSKLGDITSFANSAFYFQTIVSNPVVHNPIVKYNYYYGNASVTTEISIGKTPGN